MTVSFQRSLIAGVSFLGLAAGAAQADQVINDNQIVTGSLCVGIDCSNGESFGFDTIRLKENNLRIRAVDSSSTSSFPQVDWQLVFNDSTNGGLNKFSLESIDNSAVPFSVIYGAPTNSLFVASNGNVGFGTASPVVQVQVTDGNSPALRLEQNGTAGFASQSWDVAGNETNFFVRDVTNGSNIPFKIRPAAPNNSLYVAADGDIGLGTATPDADLHVIGSGMLIESSDTGTAATEMLEVRGNVLASGGGSITASDGGNITTLGTGNITASGSGNISTAGSGNITTSGGGNIIATSGGDLMVTNAGEATVTLSDTSDPGPDFRMRLFGGTMRFSFNGTGVAELELDQSGNVIIPGNLITTGGGGACTAADPCDAVFDPELYQVPSIEAHAAEMWSAKHLPAVGPTGPETPINVSEKMLRMLNELETAHIYIEQLNTRISELETRLNDG